MADPIRAICADNDLLAGNQPAPVTETGSNVIVARDLVFRYAGSRDIDPPTIGKLELEFRRGDITVIVGASGCGKTTLLNLIGGLIRPTSGLLEVDGGDPTRQHSKMGYMPARDGLLPWRTAIGNVMLPLEGGRSSLNRDSRRAKARALLERVGLGRNVEYYPDQLSHGMRQRVSLARALVADPQILLMDEPFGALDAQTRLKVQSDFLKTLEGSGRSVVMITHDLQEAILLGDRILVMSSPTGSILADRQVPIRGGRAGHLHELVLTPEFRVLYQDLVDIVMSAWTEVPGAAKGGGA